jgi:hypothetical protein
MGPLYNKAVPVKPNNDIMIPILYKKKLAPNVKVVFIVIQPAAHAECQPVRL